MYDIFYSIINTHLQLKEAMVATPGPAMLLAGLEVKPMVSVARAGMADMPLPATLAPPMAGTSTTRAAALSMHLSLRRVVTADTPVADRLLVVLVEALKDYVRGKQFLIVIYGY